MAFSSEVSAGILSINELPSYDNLSRVSEDLKMLPGAARASKVSEDTSKTRTGVLESSPTTTVLALKSRACPNMTSRPGPCFSVR